MNLLVHTAFKTDGPNYATTGFDKHPIPEGAFLTDVSAPDDYGYRSFTYEGQRMKELQEKLFFHAKESE